MEPSFLQAHHLHVRATVTEQLELNEHVGAALRGANSIVTYLVEKGAKLDAKNKQGFTALDTANGKGGLAGTTRDPKPATVALLQEL